MPEHTAGPPVKNAGVGGGVSKHKTKWSMNSKDEGLGVLGEIRYTQPASVSANIPPETRLRQNGQ